MRIAISMAIMGLAGGAVSEVAPLYFPNTSIAVWGLVFWLSVFIFVGALVWGVWPYLKSPNAVILQWRWMWKLEKEDAWPIRRLILLSEAAHRAYEATPDSWTAKMAENDTLSPEGAIHAYAYELLGNFDIPVYGVRGPSRVLHRIPSSDLQNYMLSSDASVLEDQYEQEPPYTQVAILQRDFRKRLREIKGRKTLNYV